MKYIGFIFIFLVFRSGYFCYYMSKTKKFKKKYEDFIKNSNNLDKITVHKNEIVRILKKAHVNDSKVPFSNLIGYGQIASGYASVMDNMFVRKQDIFSFMLEMFDAAIGEYSQQVFNSFNPIYWLEVMIYLPKSIFEYIGINGDKRITRITQVVYWITGFIYAVYNDKINQMIQDFLSNLFK